jgi:hypothetical protein
MSVIHTGLQAALTASQLPYILSDPIAVGEDGVVAYLTDTNAKEQVPLVWHTKDEEQDEETLVEFIHMFFRNGVESLRDVIRYRSSNAK